MTVIERLGYDKSALATQFEAWCHGPGMVTSDRDYSNDYDSLRDRYEERRYGTFLDWAYGEFVELVPGLICPDGSIVIRDVPGDIMQVVVLNIFDTGWKYHLDLLKARKKDVSRPFFGYDKLVFRQALKNSFTPGQMTELISRIQSILTEHDRSNPGCIVYYGLSDGDCRFYEKYDELLREVLRVLRSGSTIMPVDYVEERIRRALA